MAACITFTCSGCGFSVDSWDDGNPYIEAPNRHRYHFYHPCESGQIKDIIAKILGHTPTQSEIDMMLEEFSGNESDYICRDCLKFTKRNEEIDELRCGSCGSANIQRTHELGGILCPSCGKAKFDEGHMTAIS